MHRSEGMLKSIVRHPGKNYVGHGCLANSSEALDEWMVYKSVNLRGDEDVVVHDISDY
jgi:hypothetical protein